MNLYWLYDLPTWLFGLLSVAVTVAVGLVGFYATRKWVREVHGAEHSHNEIVGFYLGAVCLFYGITGLGRRRDMGGLLGRGQQSRRGSFRARSLIQRCEQFS
jgi:hypothetical protein